MPADLQSAVFDRFTIPARQIRILLFKTWSRWRDSNPRPAVYKTAALATELHRQITCKVYQNRDRFTIRTQAKRAARDLNLLQARRAEKNRRFVLLLFK